MKHREKVCFTVDIINESLDIDSSQALSNEETQKAIQILLECISKIYTHTTEGAGMKREDLSTFLLVPPMVEEGNYCGHCKDIIPFIANYCPFCGSELEWLEGENIDCEKEIAELFSPENEDFISW